MRPADETFLLDWRERFCRPRPSGPASKWVESNLRLNEPKIRGPFSFRGREYLRQIVDSFGPLSAELQGGSQFTCCAGTGIGKTISFIAGLCYRIANEAMRALVVKHASNGPAGARSFSRTRLIPAIKATATLRDLIPTGRDRFDFSTGQIMMNGSIVDLTGSNSVGQLAENRCDVVLLDEVDKYPEAGEADKEATPEILAFERMKNVFGARGYKFSTPTLENAGVWSAFKNTDQRRRFIPCPHCQKQVVLAWSKRFTVFEIKGYEAFIKWDDAARRKDGDWDLARVERSARYECPFCGGAIQARHLHAADAAGVYVATNPNGLPGQIGWHVPSMYSTSPDCSPGALALKFLRSKRSPSGVKGFINSDLAEPDVMQSVSVDRAGVIARDIEVGSEWVKVLTCDYHQNAPYFWAVVRAWCDDKAHGLAYRCFNSWNELDDLQKEFEIKKEAVGVDTGFDSAEVLKNCASLKIPTRCELGEPMQDALPEVIGWNPMKSFGGKRHYRDEQTGLYMPYRIKPDCDPFAGTDLAKSVRIELLEYLSDIFEDWLENIRSGKTAIKWTIAKEMDTEEYHHHMAGKVRKYSKTDARAYRWVTVKPGYPDHIRSCEEMQVALAFRLKLVSWEAVQSRKEPKP